MSEQSHPVFEEAVRLVEVLRRRMNSGGARSGDVWGEATRDDWREHIATGAAECRYCPICRAIAATRTSGPELLDHLVSAGEAFLAAAREATAGFERARTPRPESGDDSDVG